ncbi:uncharacterized protein LOC108667882 isoform X2 [Hyalella azteca]|uniref:Uncharacterized protein LOC108667882 isoform X2 n=1 Tax=Hyalella azteca TaxID=294128 RepID=A0A8B7NA62_HYAAZ|nr:uncharacterized protein LOC108667882 isoform X2 [Hyalella azteca]
MLPARIRVRVRGPALVHSLPPCCRRIKLSVTCPEPNDNSAKLIVDSFRSSSTSAATEVEKCVQVSRYSRLKQPIPKTNISPGMVISHVQDAFGATESQCLQLLKSPELLRLKQKKLLDTISIIRDNDISLSQLMRIPWLLTLSPNYLRWRLSMLVDDAFMFQTPSDGAGFCCLCVPSIGKLRTQFYSERYEISDHRNRIYYMADRLKVSVPEMSEAIAQPKSMNVMPLQRVRQVIDMLIKYQVPLEDIVRDPWMFLSKLELDARVPDAAAALECIAPRVLEVASLLGINPYLLAAYSSDRRVRRLMSRKGPVIAGLLMNKGYSLLQILLDTRVINYKPQRLAERLARVTSHRTATMSVLYYPDQVFDAYCRRMEYAPTLIDGYTDVKRSAL